MIPRQFFVQARLQAVLIVIRSLLGLAAGFAAGLAASIPASAPAWADTYTGVMPVSITLTEGCAISATPMRFELMNGQIHPPVTTAELALQCSPDIEYMIAIDAGQNPQGNDRRMRNQANGQHLRYNIYSNSALTNMWDNHVKRRVVGNTGATGQVSHTAYGQIRSIPANAGPQAGAYSDTVTVTVEF